MIIALVAFVVGWSLGSAWTAIRQAQAFRNILKDLGVTTEQLLALKDRIEDSNPEIQPEPAPPGTEIEVTLEQHNDVIYAYRKSDSQFLAQGTDRDQLIEHLKITFANGARLIIREEDGAHLVKS